MQLSFKGMFDEVDKELRERSSRINIEHVGNCDGTCVLSKKNKSYTEVQTVTMSIRYDNAEQTGANGIALLSREPSRLNVGATTSN